MQNTGSKVMKFYLDIDPMILILRLVLAYTDR